MLSKPEANAIKIKEREIYKQISRCSKDASVSKDVPILKENAGVILAMLDAVKTIKCNRDAFKELAHHAGDLIVAIRESYKNAKFPQKWLSPPVQHILQGLLENLTSMLVYVKEQASANIFLRIIHRKTIDMRVINRYHERLTIIVDKFSIQTHITSDTMLVRMLEEQKQWSNQIQHRNARGRTKKPVGKITRKAGKKSMNKCREEEDVSEEEEYESEEEEDEEEDESAWEENEVPPSMTPFESRGTMLPMHNFVLPSISTCGPWGTEERYAASATAWPPPPPPITFMRSGKGVMINQGIRNVPYSNFSSVW
ncbi:hypothetical protein BYT27DRAFT_7192510 [Phlegmacium glaucopus]|nr:hypothetical protein BYT27DRAFT_7192510 [Phlegmacium glaucopus]